MAAAAPRTAKGKGGTGNKPAVPSPKLPPATPAKVPAGSPVRLPASSPATKDPRFKKVMDKLEKSSAVSKQHPTPARKAAEAQAAAQPPANEKLAGAKVSQVDSMKEAETKKPEDNSFLSMLRAEIKKVMPKKVEDTKDFMKGDDKQQLKAAMTGNVNQQKEEAAGGVKAASNQPPDAGAEPGKDVTPLPSEPAPAQPPAVGATEATPAPKPAQEVSLQSGKDEANKALSDAEVTAQQLQKANDPRFSTVLTAKAAADKQADSGPQKYRVEEQKAIAGAASKAGDDEKQGLTAFRGVKIGSGAKVKSRQQLAKEKDEARRKEVTDKIEAIYAKTKASVDKKLESLETEVSTIFDQGADAAVNKMKQYVDKRFDERYSGIIGAALWVKDKLLPLPPEVKAWFDQANHVFMQELNALVVRVSNLVEQRLKEAKDEIARGQKEISDYVKTLAPDLQQVGLAAEREMSGRFDEMRKGVDEKKNDLAQKLAQRYKEAYDKGQTALQEMKDAHKSLLEKMKEALLAVVEVLRQFKERVMGMLKKGKETISLILADPIGFLKNLLNAIKQGINQFKNNIWTHLKAGFMKWLFGSLAGAGITLPSDFSLPSILQLVLQILGLTYDKIRAKAVKLIGERNVILIEKAFELIKALITGGPAALWEKIKEFLGDLKEMVINAIQEWVVTTIIKAAVTKLATMFNPVGAIVQAILTIYNTVMFFIERINQILDFVEAVINSVHKIATGDIGSAANWIEQALARTIPIIIGFLARLLGLSGITEKIVGIIKKVQSKVDQAVDKVIAKIVGGIKKLFGSGKGKDGNPDERTEQQKQADLSAATAEAETALRANNSTPESVRTKLPALKAKYKLTTIELEQTAPNEYDVAVTINPSTKTGKKKFDPTQIKVGDQVRVKLLQEGFLERRDNFDENKYRYVPADVIEVDAANHRFKYKTKKKAITGYLYFSDYEKTWRRSQPGLSYKVDAEWDKIKDINKWDDFNDARQVLNYRHHKAFNNPAGMEWHHIVERTAGGPHSVDNLALTTSKLNADFNQYFNSVPSGGGTGGMKLRDFLKSQPHSVHRYWMIERCFKAFGVSIQVITNERGHYQILK